MQNPSGKMKASLEEAGVVFEKSTVSGKWTATFAGQVIGRHTELGLCVRQAAEALGEQ